MKTAHNVKAAQANIRQIKARIAYWEAAQERYKDSNDYRQKDAIVRRLEEADYDLREAESALATLS